MGTFSHVSLQVVDEGYTLGKIPPFLGCNPDHQDVTWLGVPGSPTQHRTKGATTDLYYCKYLRDSWWALLFPDEFYDCVCPDKYWWMIFFFVRIWMFETSMSLERARGVQIPQLVYSLLVNHTGKYSNPKNVMWGPVCQDVETSQMICDLYQDLESFKKNDFWYCWCFRNPIPNHLKMVLKPYK